MRIGIAGFMHESNTFNPIRADRAAFEAQSLAFGADLVREWQTAHHEVGGFLVAAQELGFEPVPLVMAWATPSGPVTSAVFEEITHELITQAKASQLDGLLLALHGAMVTEDHLDADAEILARLRAALGRSFPLAVTFDLHGNLSPRLPELCDLALAYRTNPHVDQHACGQRAAHLLLRQLRGEITPCLALAQPALLINIMKQNTSLEPLASFMARTAAIEARPGILSASLLPGFAYADVPHLGPSVLVIADGNHDLARQCAEELAGELLAARDRFEVQLPDAEQAVSEALAATRLPVVLVDTGDNVGGGSAGDGTVLLAELLRQQARHAVVCLYAPEEVRVCQSAGMGGPVAFEVGGKVDRLHGEPVAISGRVRLLHDGSYTEPEVRHGGKRLNHMGPTAVVELPGDNLLVLTSLRHPPFSLGMLTCLDIDPGKMRILVVKAAIAYRAAFGPVAGTILEVQTPGLTAVDPASLPYRRARFSSRQVMHPGGR